MAQSQVLAPIAGSSTSKTMTSKTALTAAISTVSFATLLLELALTRLFSVVLFYHFAFLAISVALLGLGAGGVFAYIRRERLKQYTTEFLAPRICMASAVMIMILLEVVLRVPVSLRLDWTNFMRLTIVYTVATGPFFFTALLFSLVFAREREHISRLYGADLIGGAVACLAVVLLLSWIGGPNAVLFAAFTSAVAVIVLSSEVRFWRELGVLAAALICVIEFNFSGPLADIFRVNVVSPM